MAMPTYEYLCEANQAVLEVRHGMSERMETWGELCNAAHAELGETPADAPVKRLMSSSSVRTAPAAPSCSAQPTHTHSGGCCGGGMCGM